MWVYTYAWLKLSGSSFSGGIAGLFASSSTSLSSPSTVASAISTWRQRDIDPINAAKLMDAGTGFGVIESNKVFRAGTVAMNGRSLQVDMPRSSTNATPDGKEHHIDGLLHLQDLQEHGFKNPL